ncbi:YrzI family small protein [Peribacillus glennii]|uniref:YrzI family small protein n=1 Tax=Peribacillus glennii TaxID=2303991 RepID=A0A372LHM5_9BACI|nr:YrzI family small protein [Peribacillus glennii]RFU65793.1 YrzI family small protein [Peribacillus glennii]
MTLNLLFFTITFKRLKMTAEDCDHQETIRRLHDEHVDRGLEHRNF